jgi:ElaB/YqjD/DUF883 family membrane-anchored ribosome-binding protein
MSAERGLDAIEDSGRRLADSAQDAAGRAGASVQAGMARVSERAQDLAQQASDRVERLTGKPVEAWGRDVRAYVEAHPLQAVAATIGLGYLIGKLLSRR